MSPPIGPKFEDILERVGSAGRWQAFIFFITSLTGFFNAPQHLGSMFLGITPQHWCKLPTIGSEAESLNWTQQHLKEFGIPKEGGGEFSKCSRYLQNYSNILSKTWTSNLLNESRDELNFQVETCSSWTYDTSQVSSSIVIEWDLVCDRRTLLSLVQSIYMAGVLVGALTCGFLSDRFGRRKTILISSVEYLLAGVLTAFAPTYIVFLVFRFLTAFGAAGLFGVSFVYATEISGINIRELVGIGFMIPFSFGYMALALSAYLIRDWTTLQLVVSVPSAVLLGYYWLLPESPRWLIAKGRCKEAVPILKMIGKWNKVTSVSDERLLQMVEHCQKQTEALKGATCDVRKSTKNESLKIFLSLFQTRKMLCQTIICYITWCCASLGYYGLAFNAPALSRDQYLVTFLSGLMEIPAYIVCYLIIRYFGRRKSISFMFLLGGISCLIIVTIPLYLTDLVMFLVLMGKFCITIVFAILYLYTTEIFPTQNRNAALGSSSMCARIGSMTAPYIVGNLGYTNRILPPIIFGTTAVISGVLSLFLPESRGRNMPDVAEEVERGLIQRGEEDARRLNASL